MSVSRLTRQLRTPAIQDIPVYRGGSGTWTINSLTTVPGGHGQSDGLRQVSILPSGGKDCQIDTTQRRMGQGRERGGEGKVPEKKGEGWGKTYPFRADPLTEGNDISNQGDNTAEEQSGRRENGGEALVLPW